MTSSFWVRVAGIGLLCLVFAGPAAAQMYPGGYSCQGDVLLTNNASPIVDQRSLTCFLPSSFGHFFDLAEQGHEDEFLSVSCVDFSIWSVLKATNHTIPVRIWLDADPSNTPAPILSGGGRVDDALRGPSLGDGILLAETTIVLPPSAEGVNDFVNGRTDGDQSVVFDPPVLLPPNAVFWVEVAGSVFGSELVRYGANQAGEAGDGLAPPDGYQQTWVNMPNCNGGGLISVFPGEWVRHVDWVPGTNRDMVMQVHLDGASVESVVQSILNTAALVEGIPLSEFTGPNDTAKANRRSSLVQRLQNAAHAVEAGEYLSALDLLQNVMSQVDGVEPTTDWMNSGEYQEQVKAALEQYIALVLWLLEY